MIAYAGYQRFVSGYTQGIEIFARPRWPMSEL
jgi:N6-L-threonylcarbamoyladenine synthase